MLRMKVFFPTRVISVESGLRVFTDIVCALTVAITSVINALLTLSLLDPRMRINRWVFPTLFSLDLCSL